MKEIFIGMLSFMPEEVFIEALEEKLSAYKLDPSPENKEEFYRCCSIVSMKNTIDEKSKEKGGLEEFVSGLNQIESFKNMFDKKFS
ncbi:hypothetical protein [Empedobacter sp.]|uniref:hypothetical protein n=1 Tax=Empedobacter sp. TaxID=1927715 RepID=UPI0028978AB7|nr:hypothetical protein [Empedobacter sp.]